MNASIISSKLKAQRANLNKLDRLPPGRILVNSANSSLIYLCQVNGQWVSLVSLVSLVYLVSLVHLFSKSTCS